MLVDPSGKILANYRKSFLYYTDETWAEEGNEGFFASHLPGLGNVSIGICTHVDTFDSLLVDDRAKPSHEGMDINPYRFQTPWTNYEFANHVLSHSSSLVIVVMAWLIAESGSLPEQNPEEPNHDTFRYWLERLKPLIDTNSSDEILVVLSNRCGAEGTARYAGTSTVLGLQNGHITVYGILGQAQEKLLIVDTSASADYRFRFTSGLSGL